MSARTAERRIAADPPKLRVSHFIRRRCFYACLLSLNLLFPVLAVAQRVTPTSPAAPPPEPPRESLGRSTPRGTVLGFLSAGHKENYELAAQYLHTRLRGKSAAVLAHQLFVVLDRRLPAQLNQLSDKPEGSLPNPLRPDQDLVGTITSVNGNVDILLDRVEIGKGEFRWLFSGTTLESIPGLYDEVKVVSVDNVLPEVMVNTRLAGVALFEWFAALVCIPLLYMFTVLVSRLASPLAGELLRRLRKRPDLHNPDVVPGPLRLLFMAFVILWTISKVSLPLLARQFWSSTAAVIIIAACVWLFILLNGLVEELLRKRLVRRHAGAASILRLGRRVIDLLAIFVGMLVGLHHFGVNPTAALAGLGVGGIAVALAAQKTLENVIGGASLIFDRPVRVGDSVKFAEIQGTVEDIGLRSIRIRTMDRTVVSVPNGQIANASLENISIRDKFWFHPSLSLRWETTASQMRSVLDGLNNLLAQQPHIERDSIRVRFLRFGTSSLDVEVFAYFFARDWGHFLEIQQELLLQIMEIVQAAGTQMALQSHVVYPAVSVSDRTNAQTSLKTAVTDTKPVDHARTAKSA